MAYRRKENKHATSNPKSSSIKSVNIDLQAVAESVDAALTEIEDAAAQQLSDRLEQVLPNVIDRFRQTVATRESQPQLFAGEVRGIVFADGEEPTINIEPSETPRLLTGG